MSVITHLVSGSPSAYGVVFLIVAIDALFPFAQAEAVVITASVLAAQGELKIWLIAPIAAVAGFLGDNACYWVGRSLGDRVVRRLCRHGRWKKRLDHARKGIRRRGGLLILVGRFLPVGRTLTTFAAGTLEMEWRRFAIADATAATAWATYASMLGYAGGTSFEHSLWKPLVFALGIAFLLGLGIEVWRRIEKRRGKEVLAGEFR